VRRPPDLFANRWNLTPGYFERMRRELGGDDFYQQELEDEDTSAASPFGGIDFDAAPVRVLELLRSDFEEIAIGVDMAGGKGGGHDEWGIVAGGRRGDGHVVGLEDASGSFDDAEAGEAVLALAERWGATRVVVETNRGPGAITVINAAWQRRRAEGRTGRLHGLPELIGVVARDQKRLRAGELRPLYLGGTLHHGPGLAWLERQAREWDPDAPRRPRVDDRIDAWVHLVHYLARLAARGDAWGAAPIAQAAPPADPYRYQAPAPASDGWSDANPYSYAQPSGDPLRYT
jgi:phage terminase large subunit-like protein